MVASIQNSFAGIRSGAETLAAVAETALEPTDSPWRLLTLGIRIAKWGTAAVEIIDLVKLAIEKAADLIDWFDGLAP